MSLAIDVDTITDVLLGDGWHKVAGQSFDLDAYEFMWQGRMVLGAGPARACPAPASRSSPPTAPRCSGRSPRCWP